MYVQLERWVRAGNVVQQINATLSHTISMGESNGKITYLNSNSTEQDDEQDKVKCTRE